MDFILEARRKKTQATNIPYKVYIPNTTPFVGPPFFVFLGKKQRSRNEPWYMILLANMVLIAVKPKAGWQLFLREVSVVLLY